MATTDCPLWSDPGVLHEGPVLGIQCLEPVQAQGGQVVCVRRDQALQAEAAGCAWMPWHDPWPSGMQTLVAAEKSRSATLAAIRRATDAARDGGRLLLMGSNDVGIGATIKRAAKDMAVPCKILANRAHARVAEFQVPPIAELPEAVPEGTIPSADGGPDLIVEAGVFSSKRIDPGSRALIAALEQCADQPRHLLDLGAGIGVLLLAALRRWPEASGLGAEVDGRSVRCARRNAAVRGVEDRCRWQWWDVSEPTPSTGVDLVLCNPPWHTGTATDLAVPRAMLRHAAAAIHAQGAMLLVANRQLPYERDLNTLFCSSRCLHEDGVYKIIHARGVRR